MVSNITAAINGIEARCRSRTQISSRGCLECNQGLKLPLPKIVANIFESIEILEGDGKSPGTMRYVTYAKESGMEFHFKSKIESVDEKNKTVHYSITESELLKYYKYFEDLFSVKEKGEGSVVVWTCMYEKLFDWAPDGDAQKNIVVEMFQKLDAFLLGNNKT